VDLGLTGKVFLVTGGTSGLGLATARVLVAEGARVVVASRDGARVAAAVADLCGAGAAGGGAAAGVTVDLTDPRAPATLIAAARAEFGALDGAFVSHGGPPAGLALELSDADLDTALALAAAGPIRLLRELGLALPDGGSVVVLTSVSSIEPIPGLASSNATRTAVWGYAKTLADEVAPRGVRVNVLLPGRFGTDRLDELHASIADREGRPVDEVRAEIAAAIPMQRIGEPEELGRVAAFLLSPAASYVTGSAWRVDGGAVRGL
jgi:3-oxoacyl-[acyl-carrier protein] reductase